MQQFTHHYRRRYFDGTDGISLTSGEAVVHRDDDAAFVADFRWGGPPMSMLARRSDGGAIELSPRRATGVRLWLWWDRPLRLLEAFDGAGETLSHRIDFATTPLRLNGATYQTDLYLDLFISGDLTDHLIEDEEELEEALERGLLSGVLRDRVVAQCGELVELVRTRRWLEWLDATCDEPRSIDGLAAHDWSHREMRATNGDKWPE